MSRAENRPGPDSVAADACEEPSRPRPRAVLQDVSRKFPECFQADGSIQNFSKKFPVSRATSVGKVNGGVVVEHKGNALRRTCFLDLCAWISATSAAVRFQGHVLRLQCAFRGQLERRFSAGRVPKGRWESLSN